MTDRSISILSDSFPSKNIWRVLLGVNTFEVERVVPGGRVGIEWVGGWYP